MNVRKTANAIIRPFVFVCASIAKLWRSLGSKRQLILTIGTLVALVNGLLSLYDRFDKNAVNSYSTNETWSAATVTAEVSNVEAPLLNVPIVTNEIERVVPEEDQKAISFLLVQMRNAHATKDYTNAVQFADVLDRQIKNIGTGVLVHEQLSVLSIQIEDAFHSKNYDKVLRLIASMRKIGKILVADTPQYSALRDISQLLLSGENELFFFSAEELGRLRKWDKSFLEEYLSYLAAWGYLHPIMLDPRTRNHHTFYYEEYFGFDKPLPYRPLLRMSTTNESGNVVFSNEASVRWCGRQDFESVDIDRCIARAMNLTEEEQYQRGLKIDVQLSKDNGALRVLCSTNSVYNISESAPCRLDQSRQWEPGMKSPMTELNTVYLTKINQRVINMPYIPRIIWIVILTLICMAFASPLPTEDPIDNKKPGESGKSNNQWACVSLSTNLMYALLAVATIVIWVVLKILPEKILSYNLVAICVPIIQSILATVVFAYLMELYNGRLMKSRAAKYRETYFAELREELGRTLGRTFWFESCLGDVTFDWNRAESYYWELDFAKAIWEKHPAFQLSYNEIQERIKRISQCYSPSRLSQLSPTEIQNVAKMFRVVLAQSKRLIELTKQIEAQRIELAVNDLMSFDINVQVVKDIKIGLSLYLNRQGTNYGAAIECLFRALSAIDDSQLKQKGIRCWLDTSM